MSQVLATMLAALMIVSLLACSGSNNDSGQTKSSEPIDRTAFEAWESVDLGKWGGNRELVIISLFAIIAISTYTLTSKKRATKRIFH